MATTKRKLTAVEKHINRLRRTFEKKPSLDTGIAWKRAFDAFLPTPDGVVAYRERALEALRTARYYQPTTAYPDGYFYAQSLLTNAKLYEQLIDAKHGVAVWKEARAVSASLTSTSPEVLKELADDPLLVTRVASNPSAPAELLVQLSQGEDVDLRSLVALNPSAPPEVIARLLSDPQEVVAESARSNPSASAEVFAGYLVARGVADEDVAVLPYDVLVRQVIAWS